MRKRNRNVYVRYTEEEYKQLMNRIKHSGLSIQSYMIKASLDKRIYGTEAIDDVRGVMERLRDMDYQLNKIGVNINQIVRLAHSDGEWEKYDELIRYLEKILDMREEAQYSWQLLRLSLADVHMLH